MLEDVHRISDRRFGLVTRNELHNCGLSDEQIKRLTRTSALIRVHRAVYRLPGAPKSIEQVALAACLAIGPHAFVSHMTAAGLWRVIDRDAAPEVIVSRPHRSRQKTV